MRIELNDVTRIFHENTPRQVDAVSGVSFSARPGILLLTGASGSGKTTLLQLIAGMMRPTSGRIRIDGSEITGWTESFRTKLRRNTFGFVFQHFNLVRGMSALTNVMLPAYPDAPSPKILREKAASLLSSVGLAGREDAAVEELSGGQMQRVAIARALVMDPAAVCMDEPTAHLDAEAAAGVLSIVQELAATGTAFIIASHDPAVTAMDGVTHTVHLAGGRIP